jgi:hypothetical protein
MVLKERPPRTLEGRQPRPGLNTTTAYSSGSSLAGAQAHVWPCPLYLQTVHAASPTSSRLQLLPLVGGMLITFIISGRLVTRWGRYKIFPVAGAAVMAVGLCTCSPC